MRAVLLLAACLLLSGCVQGGFDGLGGGSPDIPDVGTPSGHGVAAGTASGHGAPQVQRGDVSVSRDGSRWRATQAIEVSNGFGGADRAAVSLASMNGHLTVKGIGADGYHAAVALFGTGTSEQMARDALASLELRTPDSLSGTGLSFGVQAVATTSIPSQAGRGGSIDLTVPRGPFYNVGADTSNGPIGLEGLTGGDISGSTSNGDVTLTDVSGDAVVMDTSNGAIKARGLTAATATLDTSNGGIDVVATAKALVLDTSNGPIDATLQPTSSGHYTMDSSNGQVRVHLKGDAQTGFDASADTSNGRASVTLAGGEPVGSQDRTSAHVRTAGFSGKAIQTVVVVDTSNSDGTVTQE